MFYAPTARDRAVLPHDPFKALIAPRPIGWISTVDADGRANLAPYSFFNAFSDTPPIVGFSSDGHKDSLANAVATGAFVANAATWDLRDAMNATASSVPHGVDEFALARLDTAPCVHVAAPRVAASPWALECRTLSTVPMTSLDGVTRYHLVIGEVVGVHIDDRFVSRGRVDTAAMQLIARAGYDEYALTAEVFRMPRPR